MSRTEQTIGQIPMSEEAIKIRMVKTVKPDFPFGIKNGTRLIANGIYGATSNSLGAVSAICDNGELLGVKPGEFQFIEAPEWLLAVHAGLRL